MESKVNFAAVGAFVAGTGDAAVGASSAFTAGFFVAVLFFTRPNAGQYLLSRMGRQSTPCATEPGPA